MKKFSAGGAQGKYDRRMADIKKDFAKDSAGKSGRALEVLEAKRAQRIADAEDDRAKRMGTDRTATRAAERLAESNLTKTRKYGAPQSVTKDTAGPTGKIADTLGTITTPKSELASKPSSFKEAFKEARSRLGAGKTFTFGGKSYTTNIAGEGRKPVQKPVQKAAPTPEKKVAPEKTIAPSKFDSKAFADLKAKMPKPTVTTTGGTALRGKPGGTPLIRFGRDVANDPARKAKLAEMKRAAEAPGATQFAKDRYKSAVSSDMYAKGGAVKKKETTMKYRSGGSTPPQPTPADRARSKKHLDELKKLKPTPEQAAAIGRANRSSGYAKGGKVKKASGGVLGGLAPNTAGGTVTRATPGNTLTGVPSPSAPAANTAAPMQSKPMPSNMGASPQERALMRAVDSQKASAPPAANTAGGTVTRATPGNTLTGVPSPSAQMQASQPLVSRPRDPTPAPQTASPTKVTPLEALQAKYSSATPNRDKSATITSAGVRTPASFDRNQALRDFNTVGRNFIDQGVPQKQVIQAQGELRKLQMDNSSTPAQHQAAIQGILARMNSLIPKKSSPQVDKRFAKGGSTKAATKSGRALVKKSADTEGRAMKKFAAGGLTSGHKAANGVAKKGLTKGKQVKMNKGGACYAKGGSVRGIDGIATKGKTRCKGARK
jgi:hypothetical protein